MTDSVDFVGMLPVFDGNQLGGRLNVTTIDKAAGLLRERISELDRERSQLEMALKALNDGATGGRERPRRSQTTRRSRAAGKAPRGKRRKDLLDNIRRNPDNRLADHAKAIGISGNQAASIAKQLVDSEEVVRTGRGRYEPKRS